MNVSDLTPDALAPLEAKLLADLEVVRKVRALLLEHRAALGLETGASAEMASAGKQESVAAPTPVEVEGAANQAEQATVVRRPFADVMLDVLRAMPSAGFYLKEYKGVILRETGSFPKDSTVKSFFNQMIRKGTVVIVQSSTGRRGNLYRCTLPASVPDVSAQGVGENPGGVEALSGGVGETPSVSAV